MVTETIRRALRPLRGITLFVALGGALFAGDASAAYVWTGVDAALASSNDPLAGGALVVTHQGRVVYAPRGFKAWSTKTVSDLERPIPVDSLSKTYTAAIAMAAIKDPKTQLSLSDRVVKWVPEAPASYAPITLAELLSMTSSSRALREVNAFNSCLSHARYGFAQCTDRLMQLPLEGFTPGSEFDYSAIGWQVLGQAVINAVNRGYDGHMNWAQIADAYLLGPAACDLTSTTAYTPDPNYWLAGGVRVGITDGGKFAQLMLTGQCGTAGNRAVTILTEAVLAEMRASHTTGLPTYFSPINDGRHYGYGLWLNDYTIPVLSPDPEVWWGAGADGSLIFVEPGRNLSGFLMADQPGGASAAIALMKIVLPLIEAQADANP